ncbi:metallophosphoesterase [Bacillus sp. FJAT-42376]|uniref:metallophosphoesterase n=1 Tax=Bacillus sp. FJAT-42376 TaxID=2014076 RepID=UPI000F4D7C6E|nr:metallophosphoesterase [Bacillus sp. FJAT-42376]AZB43367.1 metallophosphoesterase [Bacillus sp. FJAT-42376]
MGLLLLGVVLAGFFMLAYMFMQAHQNRLAFLHLEYGNFPLEKGELSILFISDIHRRRISGKLLDRMPHKPDLICIGGDLTEKGVPLERTRKNLNMLRTYGETVMVLGNNDPEAGLSALKQVLEEERIILLENDSFPIAKDKPGNVQLVGVSELKFKWDRLELALLKSKEADFRILLCHNPEIERQLDKGSGIQLALSGHTHGGQIRLFGFGPYEKGKFHKKEFGDHLISNGYGTTQLPLRLGARSEAHFITITSKKVD